MLGEVAELDAFREADLAAYGLELACQELNQRRLPAPLRPSRPIREPGTRLSLMESRIIRSP